MRHRRQSASPVGRRSRRQRGVGTTTIAVNLAVALARQGRRAVLVDADLDHGGQCTCVPTRRASIGARRAGRPTHRTRSAGTRPPGIQVCARRWAPHELDRIFGRGSTAIHRANLKNLALHADVVVVDAGSSRGPLAAAFWQAADLAAGGHHDRSGRDHGMLRRDQSADCARRAVKSIRRVDTLVNVRRRADASRRRVQNRISRGLPPFLGRSSHARRCGICHVRPSCSTPPQRSDRARSSRRDLSGHVADAALAALIARRYCLRASMQLAKLEAGQRRRSSVRTLDLIANNDSDMKKRQNSIELATCISTDTRKTPPHSLTCR